MYNKYKHKSYINENVYQYFRYYKLIKMKGEEQWL
jgi:hypothetical protein